MNEEQELRYETFVGNIIVGFRSQLEDCSPGDSITELEIIQEAISVITDYGVDVFIGYLRKLEEEKK